MWRLKWLLILAVLVIGLSSAPALADTSAEVTVTATGWVCGAPGGFTITYISDFEVGIGWTKGEGAENTMVRAKYGSYPASREDGYLVYYGDGTYASDTGVNFEEGIGDVYYTAWSQNASGAWEEAGTSDLMENPHVILIALIILALGFTVASYAWKKGMLAFAGAGSWMVTGIYCLGRSTETWDIYFSLSWLFFGLTIACVFSPLAYRETTPAGEETEEDEETRALREEMEEFDKERNRYAFLYRGRRPRRRMSRRMSRFERTGEE